MTVLDFAHACPVDGCPCGAAVVGESWTPWRHLWRMRCAAGHETTVDRAPHARDP